LEDTGEDAAIVGGVVLLMELKMCREAIVNNVEEKKG